MFEVYSFAPDFEKYCYSVYIFALILIESMMEQTQGNTTDECVAATSEGYILTHICVIRLDNHWFRKGFVTYTARSHYLNQWWYIVNLVLRSTFQCNIIWNLKVLIQENVFETVLYEMVAIFSRPQCVKCVCICQIAGKQCHHCGVTSHEVHGVSCHRQLDWLFNTLHRLRAQKTSPKL